MSVALERALERLARSGLELVAHRDGFAAFADGDRRRRPVARFSLTAARALAAQGALEQAGAGYRLTAAGCARVARASEASDPFRAQHDPIIPREDLRALGAAEVRGVAPDGPVARLARALGPDGAGFLDAAEVKAAQRLRRDCEASQIGALRGVDWGAPPPSRSPRGPGAGPEAGMAVAVDARRAADNALSGLAGPLRAVAIAACVQGVGLEAIERDRGWPKRSAKVALKLALAQLAAHYRYGPSAA